MNFTQYTTAKNNFNSTPNLCDLFKLLSVETWKRIEYAYIKPGIKVFETTITQNILFTINAFNDQYSLNIEMFEALNENVNGNDIELIIRYPSSGIEFYAPIQAKKVYRNGKYESMDHGNQIYNLLNYGYRYNAIPFYLLYNYSTNPGINNFSVEDLGCTLISANYLFSNYYNQRLIMRGANRGNYSWVIPTFNDLNPTPAFPWYDLVCPKYSFQLYNNFLNRELFIGDKIEKSEDIVFSNADIRNSFFKLNTFGETSEWINIKDISEQTYLRIDDREEYSDKRNDIFSPRSRIVITK